MRIIRTVTSEPIITPPHRSGFVAIVGRPNCGKSTLLNLLLGRKVAIVTDKPQTTRTRILGIKTLPDAQLILLDTPGIHEARDVLNKRMVEVAERALREADIVLWLVDASRGEAALDQRLIRVLSERSVRTCLALNKIDLVKKNDLLPLIAFLDAQLPEREIVPISALTGENVDRLVGVLVAQLPEGPRYYPQDELTDQTERVIAAEIVREKVLLETHEEVPYSVAVTVDSWEEKSERGVVVIKATIHVNRESQKPIVIGRGGSCIKRIGQRAREEIEALLRQGLTQVDRGDGVLILADVYGDEAPQRERPSPGER